MNNYQVLIQRHNVAMSITVAACSADNALIKTQALNPHAHVTLVQYKQYYLDYPNTIGNPFL